MGRVRHFTDLVVWGRAHTLFLDLLEDIRKFPKEQASRIVIDQMVRSVGSISANVAEGFNSRSTKQYLNYLDISKRTTAESENWYYKARDAGMLERAISDQRIAECVEISRMLQGLINSLSAKPRT